MLEVNERDHFFKTVPWRLVKVMRVNFSTRNNFSNKTLILKIFVLKIIDDGSMRNPNFTNHALACTETTIKTTIRT